MATRDSATDFETLRKLIFQTENDVVPVIESNQLSLKQTVVFHS